MCRQKSNLIPAAYRWSGIAYLYQLQGSGFWFLSVLKGGRGVSQFLMKESCAISMLINFSTGEGVKYTENLADVITERSAQANHVGRHDKILWPSRYEIILKLSSHHNLGRRTGTTRLLRTPSGRRGTGSGWPTAWRGWPPWPSSSTTRASRGPRGSGGTPRFRPDIALLTEGEYLISFDDWQNGCSPGVAA